MAMVVAAVHYILIIVWNKVYLEDNDNLLQRSTNSSRIIPKAAQELLGIMLDGLTVLPNYQLYWHGVSRATHNLHIFAAPLWLLRRIVV